MWLVLLENLEKILKEKAELKDCYIQVGGNAAARYPCIQLIRGNTTKPIYHRQMLSGTYTFFVDLQIRNEDADPKAGYEALNHLDRLVEPVLYEWFNRVGRELNLAVQAEIVEILSDLEKLRPICTSRYTVKMQYKQSK